MLDVKISGPDIPKLGVGKCQCDVQSHNLRPKIRLKSLFRSSFALHQGSIRFVISQVIFRSCFLLLAILLAS